MAKERYPLGLVSGTVGGLAATAVNLVMILWFKFGEVRFTDFAGVFILGHLPLGGNLYLRNINSTQTLFPIEGGPFRNGRLVFLLRPYFTL